MKNFCFDLHLFNYDRTYAIDHVFWYKSMLVHFGLVLLVVCDIFYLKLLTV